MHELEQLWSKKVIQWLKHESVVDFFVVLNNSGFNILISKKPKYNDQALTSYTTELQQNDIVLFMKYS